MNGAPGALLMVIEVLFPHGDDEVVVMNGHLARVSLMLAIAAAEPAVLAKYAFTLAQSFSNFYLGIAY